MRTATMLNKKALNIATMTLESFIPDLRPLLAAVFLSTPDEIDRMRLDYPAEPAVQSMLNTVCEFHKDNHLLSMFVDDGFFSEQLEHFLKVAGKNRMAGARFMPVFFKALNMAATLKLSDELQKNILAQIQWQRQKDGFVITELSCENITLYFAPDVVPA